MSNLCHKNYCANYIHIQFYITQATNHKAFEPLVLHMYPLLNY